jgi:hypothetical protein
MLDEVSSEGKDWFALRLPLLCGRSSVGFRTVHFVVEVEERVALAG